MKIAKPFLKVIDTLLQTFLRHVFLPLERFGLWDTQLRYSLVSGTRFADVLG
jgi:hypothetical protein